MRHTHLITTVEFRDKADSFYGTCWCGKSHLFGTWWTRSPRGWSATQWRMLRASAMLLIDSVYQGKGAMRWKEPPSKSS